MSRRPDSSDRVGREESRITRSEWLALGVLVVVALLLRVAHFDRLGVAHFDEGVYVSNLWFGSEQDFRYPFRHLYAPPFVPAVLEWSMIVCGPGTWGTMLPGLLFGTAMVPLVWWLGRSWFGPTAGLSSAILVAFSDVLVLYSRTALVDIVFCFWMLLGVHFVWLAFSRVSWRWAIGAGLATGLAWSTKYNGWLPLAIGLSGGLPWAVLRVRTGTAPSPERTFAVWGVVAVSAVLAWLPVYIDLQQRGGYAAVAANHAGYVVGWSGWWDGFLVQATHLRTFDGPLSWCGAVLATLGLACNMCSGRRSVALAGGLAAVVAIAAWGLSTPVLLGLVASGLTLSWMVGDRRGSNAADVACGRWLLAAWYFGLMIATPMYVPYPRLVLPWLLSTMLVVGAGLQGIRDLRFRTVDDLEPPTARGPSSRSVAVSLLGLMVSVGLVVASVESPGWRNRAGLREAAERVADEIQRATDSERYVVFVVAEPAFFHHLRRLDIPAVPVGELPAAGRGGLEAFLVIGPRGLATASFAPLRDRESERFPLIQEVMYQADPIQAADEFDPQRGALEEVGRIELRRVAAQR